jgi:NADH-quinone oxidoreductase subunit M
MTLNASGLAGSVLQMFSHGIIGGLLFAVVGRMIYDRTHTRDIATLGRMGLTKALPFAALTFTVASVASMGLPGFSGFIAELAILKGSWTAFPWLLVPAGLGVVITVAFTLLALQRVFFPSGADPDAAHTGQKSILSKTQGSADACPGLLDVAPLGHKSAPDSFEPNAPPMEPITFPEKAGAVLLMASTLFVGIFPSVLLDPILRSFHSPLMKHLIEEVVK